MKKFLVGFLAIIGSLTVVLCVVLFFLASLIQSGPKPLTDPAVLYIDIPGPLVENNHRADLGSLLSGKPMGLRDIIEAIDQASVDPNIKGLILRLDHAQSGLAQTQEIREAIKRFRETNKDNPKPTFAFADTFGELSPGTVQYYLATACENIWLQPMGSIGLTGLYSEMPFAKQAVENLKLKPQIGKRKEYKSVAETATENDFTVESREALTAVLQSIMAQIIDDIAQARNLTPAKVKDIVDHGPIFGEQMLELGLINKVAYFDQLRQHFNTKDKQMPLISADSYLVRNPVPPHKMGQPKIALIFGEGQIHRDRSHRVDMFGNLAMGARETLYAFKMAKEDPDVQAIVLRVNSPGGSPVASETIWRAVSEAKQQGIPVVISMSDLAASGGYWISAPANKIVAHPATITGSIGVVGGKMVTRDFWKEWGVNWGHVKVGKNADMWSTSEEYSDYGWQRLNQWLDYVYLTFTKKVAEGRKLPLEKVESIAKGRVWSGQDALRHGLVDKLGDLKTAVELAKVEAELVDVEVAVEVFPQPLTLKQQLLQIISPPEDDEAVSVGVLPWLVASVLKGVQEVTNWVKTSMTNTVELTV